MTSNSPPDENSVANLTAFASPAREQSKSQNPIPKSQARSKPQAPNLPCIQEGSGWSLEFGVSLRFVVWVLGVSVFHLEFPCRSAAPSLFPRNIMSEHGIPHHAENAEHKKVGIVIAIIA